MSPRNSTDATAASFAQLESALLARAEALAKQYRTDGANRRDTLLRQTEAEIRREEERATAAARQHADQRFRQLVQAGEVALAAERDRLRWQLMQDVLAGLHRRLEALAEDEAAYRQVLTAFLREAAAEIEADDLTAMLTPRDRDRFADGWEAMCQAAAPGKRVRLAEETIDGGGGLVVTGADGTVRVDNRFAGRLERLQSELLQVVADHLFDGR